MQDRLLALQVENDIIFSRFDMSLTFDSRQVWQENRHCHPDYELHIILRGSGTVDVESDSNILQDQGILIAPGIYHSPRALPGEFERFTFSFFLSNGKLSDFLRKKVPCCLIFDVTPQLSFLCHSFFHECETSALFSTDMERALLTAVLIDVFRRLGLSDWQCLIPEHTEELARTTVIDTFFETRFSELITQDSLALTLHISNRQLSRILKANYGMTFQEKLTAARMDHAACLLRTTDRKISDIAGLVGYNSEAAFFKLFRRTFHMTPGQYRRSLQP